MLYAKYFVTTEFVIEELEKYDHLLKKYNPKRKDAFAVIVSGGLQIYGIDDIEDEMTFLFDTVSKIDPKDIQYIALAYKFQIPLWTHDKALYTSILPIKCIGTGGVLEYFQ